MPAFAAVPRTPLRPPHVRHSRLCARRAPRATASTTALPALVIGLNVYSHDTSVAVVDAATGAVLFALSKERLTRRKHDGGDAAVLIRHALHTLSDSLATTPATLARRVSHVVANNHHFRIAPYEARLPLHVALRYAPPSALSHWNLLASPAAPAPQLAPQAVKAELSHHLAHAYSAVHGAPFDAGLVVVMDGMGDALHDWQSAAREPDDSHHCETSLPDEVCIDADIFRQFPTDLTTRSGASFREAETAYVFRRHPETKVVRFERVFKRWTPENAPSELPNHSFEEMESVGAVYSRVSAILFRDWNACGKVMGLAPYAKRRLGENRKSGERYFLRGDLYNGTLRIDDGHRKGLEHLTRSFFESQHSTELREHFEDLAYHVQKDLEEIVSNFITMLKAATGEENLVFAGGVALNSTVNGILDSRDDLKNVYIPPYPGDEGICIGCASFGAMHLAKSTMDEAEVRGSQSLPCPVPPYFGRVYSDADVMSTIESFAPWIQWHRVDEAQETAQALANSKVVAWFRGASEFGPRALGNRSFLADPRAIGMLEHLNKVVKKRETFRPFAPSVLAEHAQEWFTNCHDGSSPFMSLTKQAKQPARVEAIVHVDRTSRLQTVRKDHNPRYHEMISEFHKLTGVPMVLNTSFNVAGEPIVESPYNALKTFLGAEGVDVLAFPGIVVQKQPVSQLRLDDIVSSSISSFRSHQVQDSSGSCVRTSVTYVPQNFDESMQDGDFESSTQETSAELEDGFELEILELVHSQDMCAVADIYTELLPPHDSTAPETTEVLGPTESDVQNRLADLYRKRLIIVHRK